MKSLFASFFVLLVVFSTGFFTIKSAAFHRHLLSVLRKGTGWDISITNSEINIARGKLTVMGVEARDPKEKVHFTSDRILLDLSAFSIIRGKIILPNLDIARPSIEVQTTGEKMEITPDLIQKIFVQFEKSWILQNTFLEDIAVHELSIRVKSPPGEKTPEVKEGAIREAHIAISPTLLRHIDLSAKISEMSGFLPPFESLEIDLSLKKNGVRLKKLKFKDPKVYAAFKGNWQGDFDRGSLDLSGSLGAPTVLSEDLTFELEADLKDKKATIKTLTAGLEGASFDGKGTIDLEKRSYDIPFTAKDLQLESIFGKMPSAVLGPARGVATVEGRAKGELPMLQAEGKAEIQELRHGALHSQRVQGNIRFRWPDLDFEGDIKPGGSGATEGTVRGGVLFKRLYGPEYGGKMKGTLKTLDLSFQGGALEDLLPTLSVSGRLDGSLRLKGVGGTTSVEGTGNGKVVNGTWFLGKIDLLESNDITFRAGGKITFAKTEIHLPGISPLLWPNPLALDTSGDSVLFAGEPTQGFNVKGRYEKESGYFKIESFGIRRGENDLRGDVGLRQGGGADGHVKGSLDLEWLSLLPTYFREGRGLARLDLTLSGTTRDPGLSGRIDFQGNDIGLRGYSEITNLEGTLGLGGATMSPHLTGFLGDGKFTLGGHLKTDHFRPVEFDLSLKGTNLTYARANTYRVDFDADVALKGRLPSPRLSGRIDVVDGRYTKPFVVRDLVLKPFEEPTKPDSWGDRLKDVGLDLSINNSGDLRIRNNVADLYLRANLQVQGTYNRPRIGGALTVTDGTIHYLGEDFVLNEGRLEYIDPAKKEPYLTLVAQQEIPPQYMVSIELKGFLSNLDVNLSSSPSLTREDIISLLSSGVTQEELRESGRSLRSLGTGVLAGEISGLVERPITRSTGLDLFRLEASETGTLSKLSVGKNITDRLSLEFVSDFAPETAQRTFQANYYLTDNILLKGVRTWESGATPRFNLNISFRFRMY